MARIMLSPGVYPKEVDFSQYVAGLGSLKVGVIGGAVKGPINDPTLVKNQTQMSRVFGDPTLSDYGVYGAMAALEEITNLYYLRVADATAEYAYAGDVGVDKIHFRSKSKDSSINGYSVVYTTPSSNIFTITIIDSEGNSLEKFTVSEVSSDYNYFVTKLANESEYFDGVDDGSVVDPITGKTVVAAGGLDGISGIDTTILKAGIDLFADPDSLDIDILIIPAQVDPEVIAYAIDMCEARQDCMFIADTPVGLSPSEAVDFTNGTGSYTHDAFDSSYAAFYWSWLLIDDLFSGQQILVPPSGYIAAKIGFTSSNNKIWFAPAGYNRGRVNSAINVEYSPSRVERDELYGENIVNPIVNFRGEGIVIWGQKTSQRIPSALDRVNVRLLMNHIKKLVVASTIYFVFDQNDMFTWNRWKSMITPILEDIKANRGIEDYKVVMDETTVTQADIDANRMPGLIYIKPTKTAEFIPIDFIIAPTGVEL